MQIRTEKISQIAFSLIKGMGPRAFRLIMQDFHTVSEIYDLPETMLKEFIPRESIRKQVLNRNSFERAELEYEYCLEHGIEVLFFQDKRYPQRLNFYEVSPCVLYFKGESDLNKQRVVSIVGTRDPSEHGKVTCERIVKDLVKYDCLIVSGLAYGIDVTAHKASLSSNLKTIGVTAHGLDQLYPNDHLDIAKKMIMQGGLLTEYPTGTEMIPKLFPTRNRIVAAMSDVVIVIESARKGGSLITAEFANEYGKDVFAIPGRPTDKRSEGCNLLIKSHKAHLYDSIKDLEYITRWNSTPSLLQGSLFEDLSEEELQIVNFVRHQPKVHIDVLNQHLKKQVGELSALILNLELKGILKSLPGKRYICT